MFNWTDWSEHLLEFSFKPYETVMGFMLWPFLFSVVIGYVYLKQQSAIAASVAAMIIFAAFGNLLYGVGVWITLMYILVSLAITSLVLVFISKKRGG